MLSTLLAPALLGQTPTELSTAPIVGASLFKNGYAVVIRKATIPAGGEIVMRTPMKAVLGTVWIGTERGTTLSDVRASTAEMSGTRPATSLDDLIQANVGQTVTLVTTVLNQKVESKGKLVRADATTVLLESSDGFYTIARPSIVSIGGPKATFKTTLPTTERAAVWRVKGTPGGTVYVTGLVRGLTWAPSYQIDISDEKKLKITGKATLLNDLEDLNLPEARLITGFPNVPFINIPDPMDSGVSMNQFLNFLSGAGAAMAAPGSPGGMMTQNAAVRRAELDEMNVNPFDPNTLEAFRSEDLFFYRQPKVNLKVGERGYYVLFTGESDYEHVYTWESATLDTGQGLMPGAQDSVWHQLKFKNTTKMPFTTAGLVTVKDGEILGQDMMSYTSTGAEAKVKITKALDIQAEEMESEVGREVGAIKDRNGNLIFDLVTVKGTIQFVNRKGATVKMEIKKSLPGMAKVASNGGKIVAGVRRMSQQNTPSQITWSLDVPSGPAMQLTYEYQYYIPTR